MSKSEEPEMGRFSVKLTIANLEDMILAKAGDIPQAKVRRTELQGVVDCGATRLVLPTRVAAELGLTSAGTIKVKYADQRRKSRQFVRNVWVGLLGREGVFTAVLEPKRTDALIGAIVLEELDLVVDCVTQTLHPRYPDWIMSEIE